MSSLEGRLREALSNPLHGWSVGTFGAIGEFMRDEQEPAWSFHAPGVHEVRTERGGLRVFVTADLTPVAFDTLSSDGETWGQTLALCLPAAAAAARSDQGAVRSLGRDREALRQQDLWGELFDLGVGLGMVRMCVRTAVPALVDELHTLEGKPIGAMEGAEARRLILETSPNRVMLSPAARLEVYTPIPGPEGESPAGPHTHLLPKLLAAKRTHAANAPIPEGMQPVLTMHPRSPWRDGMGHRTPYAAELDTWFKGLLADYGLAQDNAIRVEVEQALDRGMAPESFSWPDSRRGRAVGRITLRRRAQARADDAVDRWLSMFDRKVDEEPDEERAQHG